MKNIVLLQWPLRVRELENLMREFPQFLFMPVTRGQNLTFGQAHWERVEIIFGETLTATELTYAPQLQWIHLPGLSSSSLCFEEIKQEGTILVTFTPNEDATPASEYVLAGILAFAKNLFIWKNVDIFSEGAKAYCPTTHPVHKQLHVQIGLDPLGSQIAYECQRVGMKVVGVQKRRTFHPNCDETLSAQDLPVILPKADVVCICYPYPLQGDSCFQNQYFALIREGAIVILVGDTSKIDDQALYKAACDKNFRGLMIDVPPYSTSLATSPIRTLPQLILTSGIASSPYSTTRSAYRHFLFNLRQYVHQNFQDMRHSLTSVDFAE